MSLDKEERETWLFKHTGFTWGTLLFLGMLFAVIIGFAGVTIIAPPPMFTEIVSSASTSQQTTLAVQEIFHYYDFVVRKTGGCVSLVRHPFGFWLAGNQELWIVVHFDPATEIQSEQYRKAVSDYMQQVTLGTCE